MVRPSEEFLLAWSSLSNDDPAPGWRAIALPPAGSVDVQAGRCSPNNDEAILLQFPTARLAHGEKLPDGVGFSVERAESEGKTQLRLALTRRSAGSVELFTAMACDVVGALDEAASPGTRDSDLLRVFVGRVRAWQEFMRKGAQVLSPEAEIGLVGEMLVLQTIIDSGVPPSVAVESWVGPLDHVQDFELGTGVVEVKATLATAGFPAKIGSLEQLDNSTRQPVIIAAVRLCQAVSGISLPDLVTALRARAGSEAEVTRLLSERLIAAGYFDTHADRYLRRFSLSDIRFVEVNEKFPRLIRSRIATEIIKAQYEMDLDSVRVPSVGLALVLRMLGAV